MERTCPWRPDQVKAFVKDVRKATRDAWDWMVPAVKEALIAEKAFSVVRAQESSTVKVDDMEALLLAMRIEAGLWNEPKDA